MLPKPSLNMAEAADTRAAEAEVTMAADPAAEDSAVVRVVVMAEPTVARAAVRCMAGAGPEAWAEKAALLRVDRNMGARILRRDGIPWDARAWLALRDRTG